MLTLYTVCVLKCTLWLERNSSFVVTVNLNGFTTVPLWVCSGPRSPFRSPSADPLKDPLHLWCLGTVSGSPPDLWLTLPRETAVVQSVREYQGPDQLGQLVGHLAEPTVLQVMSPRPLSLEEVN